MTDTINTNEDHELPSIEMDLEDNPSLLGALNEGENNGTLSDLEQELREEEAESAPQAPQGLPADSIDFSINEYLAAILNNESLTKYTRPSGTVQHDQEVIYKDSKWDDSRETFGLTQVPTEDFLQAIDRIPESFVTKDPRGQDWMKVINSGVVITPIDGGYLRSLKREGAQYRQYVESQTGPLGAARLKFRSSQSTGDQAVMRFTGAVGLGNWIQIPLWHSGFWVTLRCPGERELANFHERFLSERIAAARNTYGRVFSNTRAMLTSHLMDLVFNCVVDSTVAHDGNLRRLVSIQDINTLAWGLALLIWPDGWQVVRAVVDSEDIAKTVQQRTNIARYINIDTSLFTDRQRAHMARRSGEKMTEEQVMNYRHEFPNQGKRKIDLKEFTTDDREFHMTLAVPSVEDHVNSGTRWILDISASFDLIAKVQGGEQARNHHVATHLAATYLRRHEHWIDSIGDEEGEVTDRATISETLDRMSELDGLRERLDDEVQLYVDDTAVCVFGIPTYNPKDIDTPLPKFPHIIPIDPVQTFFTQLVQKIERIRGR